MLPSRSLNHVQADPFNGNASSLPDTLPHKCGDLFPNTVSGNFALELGGSALAH